VATLPQEEREELSRLVAGSREAVYRDHFIVTVRLREAAVLEVEIAGGRSGR
jgi:hypothetical protein